MPDFSYASAVAEIGRPLSSILLLLLSATLAYHSYLGIQVVIEDYVHVAALEFALLIIVRFACLVAFLISAIAALKLVVGA